MKFSQLTADLPVSQIKYAGELERSDPEITSIHYRSQDVCPGGLFVAVPGFKADGHDFIDDAVSRGAVAVIARRPFDSIPAAVALTSDVRRTMGLAAARFFDDPSRHMILIAITGTNGKTTTSFLIESILKSAGYSAGVIGTVGYGYNGKWFDNPVTTPESIDLQRILAEMRADGVTHAVMEASSHAIDLHRLEGCAVDVAVFTNLSQDHLDYHTDMDSYWACKKRLFTAYLADQKGRAVVNCNDPRGNELAEKLGGSCITAGDSSDHMIYAVHHTCDMEGIRAEIETPAGRFSVSSPLTGDYNLENIRGAVGAGYALNIPVPSIVRGIESLSAVPGRLEKVPNPHKRFVLVDYAHTPDALENSLAVIKKLAVGRVITVFGCGGDRDRNKRPQMGEIAVRYSDMAVITSDNPRTEEPMAIIDDILEGVRNNGAVHYTPAEAMNGFEKKGWIVESDRSAAIRLGVSLSRPGDTLVITGKGHETYQIIGKKKNDFDDRVEARRALEMIR